MPIFEYVCDKCGHEFETLQKASEAPLKICEACGAKGLRKKISAAGFRLSGSGWYETDFKSGKKKNVSGSEDKTGGETSSKAKVVALTLEAKPRQSQIQVPIKQQVKQKAVRRAATRNKKDLED